MSPAWPVPALAAQAVCARTYVLQRSNPRREYDLRPSEADQVYGGMATESPAGRTAVDSTTGQVLRFGGGFASVAYSSCCGGHTESSADAWGASALPYLMGTPCPWCMASPNYRWVSSIPFDDIQRSFAEFGPFGALRDVRIDGTDASGRARAFELVGERGTLPVKGSAFRLGVGARIVRSLLISRLTQANGSAAIEGGGLGHGVGMCQWGARGMALAGKSASDILAFYFPGTEVGND
jgi:stage II sporulation protein D